MDTRKIATEYRLTQWSQAIREKVSKGESIQEFCESRGISKNTYFYWQRKLRESVCQGLMPPTNDTAIVPSGWAVCEPAKPPGGESMVQIEIGKYRVNVSAGVSSGELEKVCRVLMSLC